MRLRTEGLHTTLILLRTAFTMILPCRWQPFADVCSWPILLKKSLFRFCRRTWAADVEIWVNAGSELLQISRSNASAEDFLGFVRANEGSTAFFNRIGRIKSVESDLGGAAQSIVNGSGWTSKVGTIRSDLSGFAELRILDWIVVMTSAGTKMREIVLFSLAQYRQN